MCLPSYSTPIHIAFTTVSIRTWGTTWTETSNYTTGNKFFPYLIHVVPTPALVVPRVHYSFVYMYVISVRIWWELKNYCQLKLMKSNHLRGKIIKEERLLKPTRICLMLELLDYIQYDTALLLVWFWYFYIFTTVSSVQPWVCKCWIPPVPYTQTTSRSLNTRPKGLKDKVVSSSLMLSALARII